MKRFWICILVLSGLLGLEALAQVVDDFSDGDFTQNPAWTGDASSWMVENGRLKSNNTTANATFYLSTANSLAAGARWEFSFELDFATSGSNYADFWIVSPQADLLTNQTGYFVRIGGTPDEISLFKRISGTDSKIIDGADAMVPSGSSGKIIVTRESTGEFKLIQKGVSSSADSLVGSVTDNEITTTSFIGIYIKQSTASFFQKHFFDDIKVSAFGGPDLTPPTLVGASAPAANQVDLNFTESVDPDFVAQLNLYSLNPNVSILSAERLATNFSTVRLTLGAGLTPNQSYTVVVSQSKDLNNNIQTASQQATFTWTPIVPVGYRSVVINEIMAAPSSSAATEAPQAEYIELYNPGLQPVVMSGWTIRDASTAAPKTIADFTLPANGYVVLTSSSNQALFNGLTPLILMTLPSLNNDKDSLVLADAQGNAIDIVAYHDTWYQDNVKKAGGYALEQINPTLTCSGPSNWIGANFPQGGSPTVQNTVFSNVSDTIRPVLLSADLSGLNKIVLTYSEFLRDTTLSASLFSLPDFSVSLVQVGVPSREKITLTLTTEMELGKKYTLSFPWVKDCAGNKSDAGTVAVGKGKPPGRYNLLITEVQADDSPENTLPASEFVEIYNNTDVLLDLTGVQLTDGSNTAKFTGGVLDKGEYLVVCYSGNVSKFTGVQKAGVLPYQMLNQEGDNLTLKGPGGNWLHQFHFQSNNYSPYSLWLKGWSLEMIDPSNPCDESGNWAISTSPVGGTPGKENSVKAQKSDGASPVLISAILTDTNEVKLKWNELIDSTFLANCTITLSTGYTLNSRIVSSSDFGSLYVQFSPRLFPGSSLDITVGPVEDCAGNSSDTRTLTAYQPQKADSSDWVLNEILFNPNSGGVDYVELYNKSAKYLNLNELYIANDEDIATVSFEPSVVAPGGYALLTPDPALTLRDYPRGKSENFHQVVSFPSFNSDSGTVRLLANGKTWQKFFYSDKFHAQILDETKGVSLERISSNLPVNDGSNWQSAAADAGYGTPGYQNSQNRDVNPGTDFSVEPKAFSPNGDGNKDFTIFTYSEAKPNLIANLRIYSSDGFLVKKLAQSANLGSGGFWKWDGANDDGNKVRVGLYLAVLETYELGGDTRYHRIPVAVAADR